MADFHIESKATPGHPDTGGWAPGWHAQCGTYPSKAAAKRSRAWKSGRREGAKYRIKK